MGAKMMRVWIVALLVFFSCCTPSTHAPDALKGDIPALKAKA
jgi:hypothetical protein